MGYQALLFCPDERTARTVTQVLSELDFAVIPCTEPFAAVKKLMGEHFDAVVVDCDNEQNATLLFKSARNAPNNQSSLAVAVVEGQTGVARAFRIGANLVLTKPVNVEQAKGTLRVARGLLRKSEAAKPATGAATAAVKSAAPVPEPSKLVPPPTIPPAPGAGLAAPMSPWVAAGSSPTQELAQAGGVGTESDRGILDRSEEAASPSTVAPEVKIAASQPEILSPTVGHSPSSLGSGRGAASAPAPAREQKPRVATDRKPSTVISEPETPVEKTAAAGAILQSRKLLCLHLRSHSAARLTAVPSPPAADARKRCWPWPQLCWLRPVATECGRNGYVQAGPLLLSRRLPRSGTTSTVVPEAAPNRLHCAVFRAPLRLSVRSGARPAESQAAVRPTPPSSRLHRGGQRSSHKSRLSDPL